MSMAKMDKLGGRNRIQSGPVGTQPAVRGGGDAVRNPM